LPLGTPGATNMLRIAFVGQDAARRLTKRKAQVCFALIADERYPIGKASAGGITSCRNDVAPDSLPPTFRRGRPASIKFCI
jgi:hypothetical protein